MNTDGTTSEETYSARERRPGGGGQQHERNNIAPRRGGDAPSPNSDAPPRTGRRGDEGGTTTPPLIIKAPQSGKLVLTSSVVTNGGALPNEFNGDGAGISPPLEWRGAPAGTKRFALVMDHLAPGNVMKSYWTMWDIPATATSLPKNVRGIGQSGPSFRSQVGYEPPHSQGPGLKTYTIHLYAMSASPQLTQPAREVTREVLLNAIKDSILDSAEMKVTYTRPN